MNIPCIAVSISILVYSCSPRQGNDQPPVASEPEAAIEHSAEAVPTAADSLFAQSLIDPLSTIEKYAVGNNYYMLASLLKYKGDSASYLKLKTMLGSEDEMIQESNIDVLDANNGYIRYSPIGAEVTYTHVYWRLSNGSLLYGSTAVSCGPICDCSISFAKFENGIFTRLNNDDVIPTIDVLKAMLYPGFADEEDPLEFIFELPQKGKNIRFCLQNCLDLVWNDGKFELKR